MIEEWRPVKGYEGKYEVSSLGNVRSLGRYTPFSRIKGKMLTPKGTPYLTVDLWSNNKGTSALVHRLVAIAFIPNPDNLPEVDHKDGDCTNNSVSNLQWVTAKENTRRRVMNANRPYRTKVKCLETGEIFSSISAAGRFVNTDATRIIESINTQSCCKNYTFVYADTFQGDADAYMNAAHAKYQNFHPIPIMQNSIKVKCVETGQVFSSVAEASRFYQCDSATIKNRIRANKPFKGATLVYVDKEAL